MNIEQIAEELGLAKLHWNRTLDRLAKELPPSKNDRNIRSHPDMQKAEDRFDEAWDELQRWMVATGRADKSAYPWLND